MVSPLSSALVTLYRVAETTEKEFLAIGSKLQEIHRRSFALSQTAQHLVETASGERLRTLTGNLQDVFSRMNTYLDRARNRDLSSFATMESVPGLLKKAREPLAGVKKMSNHLYILEVSIKIESAYLGDMGSEFVNLAIDLRQLSQATKAKVGVIEDFRSHLETIIAGNRTELAAAREAADKKAVLTLERTSASLTEMIRVSQEFFRLGCRLNTSHLGRKLRCHT